MSTPTVPDPERWVDDHGDTLFHYALSRLRDSVQAEDFVQDALLAGLESRERFAGRSSERSWLTGILKNKILDHFRKAGRETVFTDLEFYRDEESSTFDNPAFPEHWNAAVAPSEWSWSSTALVSALTLTCRHVAQLASQHHERPLGRWTRLRVRTHAGICRHCDRYLRQMDFLREAAGRSAHVVPRDTHDRLTPDARARIKRRLQCGPAG